MADDAHLIEHGVGTEPLYRGWLDVHRDTVRLPDGNTATREYIRHGGAVAIVPLLDDGRLVMVRQYRYPIAKVLLEIPAGKLDPGEDQLTCAARELAEETGYTATEWAYGGEIHNAPAYSTESIWLWFARGLRPGAARPDAEEFVETVLLTPDELAAESVAGRLPDVKTQIGLLWRLQWQAGRRAMAWQAHGPA